MAGLMASNAFPQAPEDFWERLMTPAEGFDSIPAPEAGDHNESSRMERLDGRKRLVPVFRDPALEHEFAPHRQINMTCRSAFPALAVFVLCGGMVKGLIAVRFRPYRDSYRYVGQHPPMNS